MASTHRGIPALLLALAACDGIDTRDAAAKVGNIAAQTMKSEVAKVECPEAERAAGVAFECAVTFAEGGTHRIRLTQTDDHGNFTPRWVDPVISRRRLAESIAEAARFETGGEVSIDCGSGVDVIPAEGFTCTARTAARGERTITVLVDPRDASWQVRDPL